MMPSQIMKRNAAKAKAMLATAKAALAKAKRATAAKPAKAKAKPKKKPMPTISWDSVDDEPAFDPKKDETARAIARIRSAGAQAAGVPLEKFLASASPLKTARPTAAPSMRSAAQSRRELAFADSLVRKNLGLSPTKKKGS